MDIIGLVIRKPVTVTVGVLLLVMFGLIGLTNIPIQLTPTVDRPIITVETNWPGRSPQEVVNEITREQELQLKNVSNLMSMRSISREGQSEITLEFYLGSDISRALQEVSDSLRQVPSYPEDVDEPTIKAADGDAENAIAWIIFDLDPDKRSEFPDFDIAELYDAIDKEIKPAFERVGGVAEVNLFGGREREVHVMVDPVALAQRSLTYGHVIQALRNENRDVSAGSIEEGKRDYRVRVVGQFVDTEQVLETVVAFRDGRPVYVKDVAEVEFGFEKRRGFVRSRGQAALAMNVIRQSGSNVMDIMKDLRERQDEIRAEVLPNIHPEVGPYLRMQQLYDETIYIQSAIDLVTQNLWIGGSIAIIVLLLFLRSLVSTGIIAIAIPISVIGTFLVLLAMGRTLNVISLAGLAFAIGVVVDNAIVVLENIYRRMQEGDHPRRAAYNGAKEVWGAILASTLTTIAVFIPILTIEEEAGQLFRDIAIAIAGAVALSLLVSITVIPAAGSRWLRPRSTARSGPIARARTVWYDLFGLAKYFAKIPGAVAGAVYWMITGWRGWTVRPAVILFMTIGSLIGAVLLMPPLDYLPAGNRNLVFGGLLIPPGLSMNEQQRIAESLEVQLNPYAEADVGDPASVAALPPIPRADGSQFDPVPIQNYFIGAFQGQMFLGATSQIEQVVIPVGQLVTNTMNQVPDAFGGARQTTIFGQGAGGGGTINMEISGLHLPRVVQAADAMFQSAAGIYGFSNVRPDPSNFNLEQQEYRVRLNDHGRELGLTTSDLGTTSRALFDGAFVGEFRLDADNIDMLVIPRGGRLGGLADLPSTPITTPAGFTVPLDTIAEVVPAKAPQAIQRIEELPSVTIQITPPDGVPLEAIMTRLREDVIALAREQGLVDQSMRVRLEGTAAQLDQVRAALIGERSEEPAGVAQRMLMVFSGVLVLAGFAAAGNAIWKAVRGSRDKRVTMGYAAVGLALLGLVLGGLLLGVATNPQLGMARFIWALAVTYLLMCALFESFIYPVVIMFTVPLAIVGGFAGLKIVHEISVRNPVVPPQQLDVLTMLGFIILIGVVVNNAILLVYQSLNFMRGEAEAGRAEPMPPLRAIARSVETRIRPIFMSVTTSVGGMMPLVLFPGAGSEMYRGLGSVVIGGLIVSTIFTILLVPLLFSLVLQMAESCRTLIGATTEQEAAAERRHIEEEAASEGVPSVSRGLTPERA